ncbi:hypothetical protein EV702DRAFT_149265 [Suillus placidus]|uniref:Uncharacterized protein n=1 Tax=Suillus placidus TaxID=48579 RepID=A0A9P6ZGE6_9AGAM|nr:hypothetical protein EV702DRAFT_149265 [Suillus placidus]
MDNDPRSHGWVDPCFTSMASHEPLILPMNFNAFSMTYSWTCLLCEAGIEDRSKGGGLSNGIAMLQLAWFIIHLVAYHVQPSDHLA